jgi:hypothetical protein
MPNIDAEAGAGRVVLEVLRAKQVVGAAASRVIDAARAAEPGLGRATSSGRS